MSVITGGAPTGVAVPAGIAVMTAGGASGDYLKDLGWSLMTGQDGGSPGGGGKGGKGGKNNNAKGKLFGAKGTKTDSKSICNDKNSKARVDIENAKPGERKASLHYHDSKGTKFQYDKKNNKFYNAKTNEIAPKNIQNLLKDKDFKKVIEKGLCYLGED